MSPRPLKSARNASRRRAIRTLGLGLALLWASSDAAAQPPVEPSLPGSDASDERPPYEEPLAGPATEPARSGSDLLEQAGDIAASEESDRVEVAWEPPEPSAIEFDWLRLTSGEWVRGRMKRLRDREVFFDSEEFDDIEIDWADVETLYLPRSHTFRFEGRRIVTGSAEMRGGVIRVRSEEGVVEFERHELVSAFEGGGTGLDLWSLEIGVGLAARSGNTDQIDLTATAAIYRRTPLTRWGSDYLGAYGKVDGSQITNNHRAQSNFDVFITRRLFVRVPQLEFFRDEQQNIAARVTPGVGFGYEFVRNNWLDWDFGPGIGYQYTSFDSTDTRDSHDMALTFQSTLDIEITNDIDLDNTYQLQLITTDIDKTNHHFESTLSFDVWGPLDFDLLFILDRIEGPERDDDGETPSRNDYRITAGLSLEL